VHISHGVGGSDKPTDEMQWGPWVEQDIAIGNPPGKEGATEAHRRRPAAKVGSVAGTVAAQ
jgi:hypothetical protein